MSSLSAAAAAAAVQTMLISGWRGAEASRTTAPEERRPETAANVTLARLVINRSAVSGGGGGVLDFYRCEKEAPLEKMSGIDSSAGGARFIIHPERYACPPNVSTAVAISTAAQIQMH